MLRLNAEGNMASRVPFGGWGGVMRQERAGEGGFGANGAPAAKWPSGSGYSVRGEHGGEGRGAGESTWHEIALPCSFSASCVTSAQGKRPGVAGVAAVGIAAQPLAVMGLVSEDRESWRYVLGVELWGIKVGSGWEKKGKRDFA